MAGNVWVVAEHWRGRISDVTFELLALGRELADGLGVPLEAVVLCHQAKELSRDLGAADNVLFLDHPSLAVPTAESYGAALAQLIQARKPQGVLVPLSNVSWDWVGVLPAMLGAPYLNFCKDVRVVDGKIEACCLLYGGKMEVLVAPGSPAILGILPGARIAASGSSPKQASVADVPVELGDTPRIAFKQYIEPEQGGVDITKQPVLVSVGRGIGNQENLAVAEELAAALGGAVSGSRPVIDQSWLPLSRQVGKSGATVKPKLYLAVGISGAPEHVEGMKNSELIIAINTDPQAPIFDVAHYGIVGDAMDTLSALTAELQKASARKGA
jgi:electron transfer flavoprotein alpha subunit